MLSPSFIRILITSPPSIFSPNSGNLNNNDYGKRGIEILPNSRSLNNSNNHTVLGNANSSLIKILEGWGPVYFQYEDGFNKTIDTHQT